MAPNDYDLGRQIGGLAQKIDNLVEVNVARHRENVAHMNELEKGIAINRDRIETLWQFRARMIWIGTGIVALGTTAVHVGFDILDSFLKGTGHG